MDPPDPRTAFLFKENRRRAAIHMQVKFAETLPDAEWSAPFLLF